MTKFKDVLLAKNIAVGWLYFYIHFITEVVCFYYLTKVTNGSPVVWLIPFLYDALAFVPQGIIGKVSDKYPKVNIGFIGVALLFFAIVFQFGLNLNLFLCLIILTIGNCIMHISGAEDTLRLSNGKLSHPAIFVAGGSFGVVTGKILASSIIPFWGIALMTLTMIPFLLLAKTYHTEESFKENACEKFDYANVKMFPFLVIVLATLVVIVRGYIGYGIPTAWNKTLIQNIIFFFTMGLGKALGGILTDRFGIRKVAVTSTLLAIPFLCFGDNLMMVSLIGVMFFSMTMAITLGIIVSTLKNNPGVAFGFTTIGLFLGTAPIFFIKITNPVINIVSIVVSSIICCLILLLITKGKET